MASVITPGSGASAGFQYYVENADDVLLQDLLEVVQFSEYGTVTTGVVNQRQIAMMGNLPQGLISNATCGDADPVSNEISQKVWDPKPLRFDVEQCEADLRQSAYFRELLAEAADRPDLDQATVFSTLIINMVQQRMGFDAHRSAWFNDTGYTTEVSAGDLPYFNTVDGIWKQVADEVASPTITGDTLNRVEITENSLGNYDAQLAGLTPADAYGYIKDVYDATPPEFWQASGEPVFLVTRTIEQGYRAYMEAQGNDLSFGRIERDTGRLIYRGVEVISMPMWDATIRGHFLLGAPASTPADRPHRIMLTKKDNIVLALGSGNDLLQVKTYFDANPTVEKWYASMKSWLDAKLLWNYKTVVAY